MLLCFVNVPIHFSNSIQSLYNFTSSPRILPLLRSSNWCSEMGDDLTFWSEKIRKIRQIIAWEGQIGGPSANVSFWYNVRYKTAYYKVRTTWDDSGGENCSAMDRCTTLPDKVVIILMCLSALALNQF